MPDQVFTTGNANVQAFTNATAYAQSRAQAAEQERAATEAARLALPTQVQALTAPAVNEANAAAAAARVAAGLAGSVSTEAELVGKPAGQYRVGVNLVTWNGNAVTASTPALATAEQATTAQDAATAARSALGNTALAELAAKGQADGPQQLDGSRWLWRASGTPNGGAAPGTIAAASDDGFWHREHLGVYLTQWFAGGAALTNQTIQAAIDAAAADGVGSVYLSPGTYACTTIQPGGPNYLEQTFITPRNGVSVYGAGVASVIRVPNGFLSGANDATSNAHVFQAANLQNVTFREFRVDGNGANNLNPVYDQAAQTGIRNQIAFRLHGGGNNITFDGVEVVNLAGSNAFNLSGAGNGARFLRCRVINGGPWVNAANPNNHDFSAGYSEWADTQVQFSTFDTNPAQTSRYCGGFELHGSNSAVTGSYFRGYYPAIYLSDSPGAPVQGQSAINNEIIDCFQGIVFAYFAAGFKGGTVSGNRIRLYKPAVNTEPSAPVGILYTGPGRTSGGYFGTAQDGSPLGNASKLENTRITDNTIEAHPDQMSTLESVGMNLHSLHSVEITGNLLTNLGSYGIGLFGSAWGDNGVLIDRNTFRDIACVPNIAAQVYRAGVFVAYRIDASPFAVSPDRAFTAQNVRIGAGNHYLNSVTQTVNSAQATTALSSAGRMLTAVSLINLSYYAPLSDVVIESGHCLNVAHRIWYSNAPGLSYNIGAVTLGLAYRPKVHTSSARPIVNTQLYPGDVIEYPDGTRGAYSNAQPTVQGITLNAVVGTVAEGSRTVALSGADAALLRPGTFIQVGGHYSTVRTVDSLTQITLEDPAGAYYGGATVQVVSVPPLLMAPQTAPAALTGEESTAQLAAYINNLVDRLVDGNTALKR